MPAGTGIRLVGESEGEEEDEDCRDHTKERCGWVGHSALLSSGQRLRGCFGGARDGLAYKYKQSTRSNPLSRVSRYDDC